MKIDINGVSITLTPEQLAEIARQTNQLKTYKDITSFEKACERLGLDILQFNSELTKGEIALRKLKIIVRAIRSFTYWKPVWSNAKQWKYIVWFDLEKGFSYWNTTNFYTTAYVPSALFVESHEQAEFLGETYLELYKDYIFDGE